MTEAQEKIKECMQAMEALSDKANPKQQKALAIAKATMYVAEEVIRLSHYLKKKPRFLRAKKYSRKEATLKRLYLSMQAEMTRAEIQKIIWQSIIKPLDYAPGGIVQEMKWDNPIPDTLIASSLPINPEIFNSPQK